VNSRWGQILAVFAVVAVVVGGIVIVAMATGSQPGAGPRPTATATKTKTATRTTTRTLPEPRPTLTADSGCRIGRGPQRLVDVPQTVTDRVNRAWERIEKWLAANAPASAATLAPPASMEAISRMQQQIGVPVPAELIASLRRHDGAGTNMRDGFTLPPFYIPMSAEGIISEAKMMCDVLVSSGYDDNVGSWWHGQVIPIAFDGGGGNLLLDQRPGRGGRLGDHDEESDMMFTVYPRSLTELLEQTATSLETGRATLERYHPKVVDGALDWDIK
jgi:cell wall assembly regulator SMI1